MTRSHRYARIASWQTPPDRTATYRLVLVSSQRGIVTIIRGIDSFCLPGPYIKRFFLSFTFLYRNCLLCFLVSLQGMVRLLLLPWERNTSVVLPAGEVRHRNLKKKWSLSGTFCCCTTPKNNVGIYKVGLVNTGNNNLALWLSITKESNGCAVFRYAPPFLVCPSFPTPTFLLVCSGHV